MKRIITITLLILTIIMGYSKVTAPDFAFPKTVAKDASADLKEANKRHDAHAAINALIRIAVAETLIDQDSLQSSIKLVEQTARNYEGDPLYGLFPALLSSLYKSYYEMSRWNYDRRETPLEPYPADISEWSGKQFRKKIVDNAKESISGETGRRLRAFALTDFEDIISTGKLTTTYYPTLLDFCYSNAIESANFDNEFSTEVMNLALKNSEPGSAPDVMWTWKSEVSKIVNGEATDIFNSLFEKASSFSGNKYAGYMIQELSADTDDNDIEQSKKFIELATKYIQEFPNTPFKNAIKDRIEKFKTPKVKLSAPNLCSPGRPFDVNVSVHNANKINLNVYFTGQEPLKEWNSYNALLAKKPTKTLTLKYTENSPFRCDTTTSLIFDKPGYYYVIPVFDDKKIQAYSVNRVRCIPAYPIVVSSDNMADILTVDPYDGSPIKNAEISLTNRYRRNNKKTVIDCGHTDSDGVVNVYDRMKADNGYFITATIGGKAYPFEDVTIFHNGKQPRNISRQANVLTDRMLYHPGDSADVLVVMSTATPEADGKMQQSLTESRKLSVILYDANYQQVDTIEMVTDDWGRATASFHLPENGLTGNFTIRVHDKASDEFIGYHSIVVSDYKMPDFEIKIDETACDEPSKGFVTIKGTATSYSGMPVADATITLSLSESSWGWWRWRGQQNKINTQEVLTDGQGKYTFVIPDSVLTNRKKLYMASIDAVSPTGSTAQTSTVFMLSKKYDITVNIPGSNVDGEKLLRPDVKVYAPDGSTVDILLEWALVHDNDTTIYRPFKGEIDLSEVKPASYDLVIRSVDQELAEPSGTRITVYNITSGIVPEDYVLWVPKTNYTANADGQAEVIYANAYDDTYIYCYITNGDNTERPTLIKARKGYNKVSMTIAPGQETSTLNLYTVREGKMCRAEIVLSQDKQKRLKIIGESFRDNLIPGARETWKIKITDTDDKGSQSALILDMYNKALDALMSQHQSFNFPTYERRISLICDYVNFSRLNCNYSVILNSKYGNVQIETPAFMLNPYSNGMIYGSSHPRMMMAMSDYAVAESEMDDSFEGEAVVRNTKMAAPAMARGVSNEVMLADMAAPIEESAVTADAGEADAPEASTDTEMFDYRDSDVPLAIWAPLLTTDKNGEISYTFTVPNANTTWRLQAVAWSKDMEVGSMMRDFVASKPVMVQPNLPRFLRNGDEAIVLASVMNNTDIEQNVTTTVEIFNPLTSELIKTKTFVQTIGPKGYDKVSVSIPVGEDINVIGYRIRSSNGDFSDGEQSVIRVLPSEQDVIETMPFYLNPGEKEFTITLPDDEGARLSLTFCENPAWTIVTALPGLRTDIQEYTNSAGAAIYASAIARGIVKDNPKIGEVVKSWLDNPDESALVSMLEKNEELKIAVLNATPWVNASQSQSERMANLAMIFDDRSNAETISKAVKILADLQNSDGGWAWGKWCNESSLWATSNVLAMLGDLRQNGWMPADKQLSDMVTRAVNYYDREVEKTDLLYCLVRPLFQSPVSTNGKKVITATLNEIKKNWKSYTDPAYKAMAAQALYLNGEKKTALELMNSLSEFGVYTKNQGLKFPNVNALYNYAILLDAYSTILPESKEVDGLRQQLIVRKQGTDWGDAVVTMEVVKSILSSESTWTVDAEGTEITAGNHSITPKGKIEKATGSLTADLSDYAGQQLTVTTTGTGPSYGAVYCQSVRPMDKVEAYGCDDLTIEKQMFVRRGSDWAMADNLSVGDRVKIQLTIHCKRNLQYVEIIDNRPAAFEPVKQLPGWEWSEGVGFYRENRDAQTNMHVVYMSPGTYLLTYEMNVNLAGSYSSGVATIQSLYAPELSAHSSGCMMKVK